MRLRLAFFEGDEMLGFGLTNTPGSTHFMCPECAVIWGREICLDTHPTLASSHPHRCEMVHCPEHTLEHPLWTPPVFSLRHPRFEERTFPREVLARDFLLLCELYPNDQ